MTTPQDALSEEGLAEMVERRIGQDFDGEAHFTEHEARQIAVSLRARQGAVVEEGPRRVALGYLEAMLGRIEHATTKPAPLTIKIMAADSLALKLAIDALSRPAPSELPGVEEIARTVRAADTEWVERNEGPPTSIADDMAWASHIAAHVLSRLTKTEEPR